MRSAIFKKASQDKQQNQTITTKKGRIRNFMSIFLKLTLKKEHQIQQTKIKNSVLFAKKHCRGNYTHNKLLKTLHFVNLHLHSATIVYVTCN